MVLRVVDRAGWLGAITMGHKMNFENEQACSPQENSMFRVFLERNSLTSAWTTVRLEMSRIVSVGL